ncbi:hypothetical protein [Pseudomonas phage vB_PaeM_PAO1_Ab17]|uniref:Uncharacterized protein n=4 Tax=Nankokuvirus TaxID=1925779 RepID=A0A0A1IWX6_9CAUD|nr:hypothetical protein X832_gp081 [Pseudomonas phage PAK_P5]YP_008858104.1 hypothetical protein X837_gp081 [Pseudomonas phage CHA_P1]YP_009124532.1 hypothetical protein VC54_gp075 [Pseudomonas phage vB_PaeM_PAO1_Ab03]WKW88953.1 hypothetical protein LSL4_gp102 [Pseudomonas phage LSL4]CEF89617.1 hypothetical protein [Pseudomonas phage vB_PaeM_PAO1_Ab17]AGR89035.1 hypothetical protein CHA_P10081 [Pseudomonas phage CHA_P1]AGR89551.1 hypothetical protein PAK_P500081 [Pseudomonas phage PAK_P5]CEF
MHINITLTVGPEIRCKKCDCPTPARDIVEGLCPSCRTLKAWEALGQAAQELWASTFKSVKIDSVRLEQGT